METEIIVAIIAGCATIIAATIAGVFSLINKKGKAKSEQNIQGNGNIQAGKNIRFEGGVRINAKSNDKRK